HAGGAPAERATAGARLRLWRLAAHPARARGHHGRRPRSDRQHDPDRRDARRRGCPGRLAARDGGARARARAGHATAPRHPTRASPSRRRPRAPRSQHRGVGWSGAVKRALVGAATAAFLAVLAVTFPTDLLLRRLVASAAPGIHIAWERAHLRPWG